MISLVSLYLVHVILVFIFCLFCGAGRMEPRALYLLGKWSVLTVNLIEFRITQTISAFVSLCFLTVDPVCDQLPHTPIEIDSLP